jgi:hypothetical protein
MPSSEKTVLEKEIYSIRGRAVDEQVYDLLIKLYNEF